MSGSEAQAQGRQRVPEPAVETVNESHEEETDAVADEALGSLEEGSSSPGATESEIDSDSSLVGSPEDSSPGVQCAVASRPQAETALNCPRCDSANTKFCYYNNHSLTQPRYFCKTCRRYWTQGGGSLRNVPVGGGARKTKRSSSSSSASSAMDPRHHQGSAPPPVATLGTMPGAHGTQGPSPCEFPWLLPPQVPGSSASDGAWWTAGLPGEAQGSAAAGGGRSLFPFVDFQPPVSADGRAASDGAWWWSSGLSGVARGSAAGRSSSSSFPFGDDVLAQVVSAGGGPGGGDTFGRSNDRRGGCVTGACRRPEIPPRSSLSRPEVEAAARAHAVANQHACESCREYLNSKTH